MARLRVNAFTVSADGFGAGPTRPGTNRSAAAAKGCTSRSSNAHLRAGSPEAGWRDDRHRQRLRGVHFVRESWRPRGLETKCRAGCGLLR